MNFLSQSGHGNRDEFLLIDATSNGSWCQDGPHICVSVSTKDLTPMKLQGSDLGDFSKVFSLGVTLDDFIDKNITKDFLTIKNIFKLLEVVIYNT